MTRRGRFVAAETILTPIEPVLVTVPNIELLEVGEDWETSTGVFTWDTDDLVSAIAAVEDPSVRSGVIKLGHTDPRFDGQPAWGRIGNLHLDNNDQTLVGDFLGIPAWLAEVMPTAFPRRSIEGWFDYRSKTGNEWPFILTGVALLGEAYPAINTLEDLPIMWGAVAPPLVPAADVPEVIASTTDHGTFFRATKMGDPMRWRRRHEDNGGDNPGTDPGEVTATMPTRVQAAVSVEDIRRTFYDELGPNEYWWWIRQVNVDPQELIVDDDEGHLFRVPWDVTGSTIVFSDPIEVQIEYVDVAAKVAAKYTTPEEAKRPVREGMPRRPSASGIVPPNDEPEEERDVNLSEEALRALGLEPGATDDEINAAIMSAQPSGGGDPDVPGETPDVPGGTPDAPETPAPAPAETPAPTPAPETAPAPTSTLPDGMVLIDTSTLEELRSGVAAARADLDKRATEERDRILAEAVRAGKFAKARIPHYTKAWELDPEGTRAAVASLESGLIPVKESGQTTSPEGSSEDAAYPDTWKPAIAKARKGVGSVIKVVAD